MKEVEIKIMELLDNHPKSLEIITSHFTKMMIESFNEETVPEEFKEAMMEMGVGKERLALIIGSAPRCLFDCFDENEIFIEVYRTSGDAFTFNIEGFMEHPTHFIKRKDCELSAIIEAFKLLEKK